MGRTDLTGGDYDDWISNLTDIEGKEFVMCHECRSYIRNDVYWCINEEVLCDDCAKAKYQRGIRARYEI